jgi:hypothetical protein
MAVDTALLAKAASAASPVDLDRHIFSASPKRLAEA